MAIGNLVLDSAAMTQAITTLENTNENLHQKLAAVKEMMSTVNNSGAKAYVSNDAAKTLTKFEEMYSRWETVYYTTIKKYVDHYRNVLDQYGKTSENVANAAENVNTFIDT